MSAIVYEPPHPPPTALEDINGSIDIDEAWAAFFVSHSVDSRNILLTHYLPFVKNLAINLARRLTNVEVDELASSGTLGLIDAIHTFDSSQGVKFECFAMKRIRGSMIEELRRMDWVPRTVRERRRTLQEAAQAIFSKTGENAQDSELAKALALDRDDFDQFKKYADAVQTYSLDQALSGTDGKAFTVGIKDPHSKETSEANEVEFLQTVCRGLNKQERLLIILYYIENLTLREIGKHLGFSESRVSRMRQSIINRFQERFPTKDDYDDPDAIDPQRIYGKTVVVE